MYEIFRLAFPISIFCAIYASYWGAKITEFNQHLTSMQGDYFFAFSIGTVTACFLALTLQIFLRRGGHFRFHYIFASIFINAFVCGSLSFILHAALAFGA